MDRETVSALDRINRDFYAAHAAEFSAARETPWPGWERLLPHLAALPARAGSSALRILDAGCGSGRLARWLRTRLARPHRTVGLDRSLPILLVGRDFEEAAGHGRGEPPGSRPAPSSSRSAASSGSLGDGDRIRAPGGAHPPGAAWWLLADLVSPGAGVPCRDGAFDGAVAIGLLHHLPSFALRRAVVTDLLRVVERGGLVVLAFWQFGADPRFERRAVSWEHAPIDRAQLEPGDRLLRWGEGAPPSGGLLRYCHYADPQEADRLTAGLPVDTVDSFFADGRGGALNLYRVLRRT